MTTNIAGKSIDSAIKSLLNSEYKFLGGDKIQEMFVEDVMRLFKKYNCNAWNMKNSTKRRKRLMIVQIKNKRGVIWRHFKYVQVNYMQFLIKLMLSFLAFFIALHKRL